MVFVEGIEESSRTSALILYFSLTHASPLIFFLSDSCFLSRQLHELSIMLQVKMKNLRREVRLYKESLGRGSSRKPSEVATACEKLLPEIEDIFNKVRKKNKELSHLG